METEKSPFSTPHWLFSSSNSTNCFRGFSFYFYEWQSWVLPWIWEADEVATRRSTDASQTSSSHKLIKHQLEGERVKYRGCDDWWLFKEGPGREVEEKHTSNQDRRQKRSQGRAGNFLEPPNKLVDFVHSWFLFYTSHSDTKIIIHGSYSILKLINHIRLVQALGVFWNQATVFGTWKSLHEHT